MMRRPSPRAARRQSGAALLAAMLTVMLVATFAAAALWQQWRATEVEAAERGRVQAAWVLVGALDYSRLALAEDGRAAAAAGGVDHLGELWAVPLQESRLTSFLAADRNVSSDELDGLPEAFLSGHIVDAQSKLNVLSLVNAGKPDPTAVATFTKLFGLLGLPVSELNRMTSGLVMALANGSDAASGDTSAAPLLPQESSQLTWLGLSQPTADALAPYVTILPTPTTLNINTASAEALSASVPSMSIASARQLVDQRSRSYFKDVAAANALLPSGGGQFNPAQHGVATSYFEVYGRLRLEGTWVEEHSLVQRNGVVVTTLWRVRGAGATLAPVKP